MPLLVLLGGARSGKSMTAVDLALAAGGPVVFVATGRDDGSDPEWSARVARHRAARPAGWTTVEEPLHLERTMCDAPPDACVVIDCLTLWVANLLDRISDDGIVTAAQDCAGRAAVRPGTTIAVSNEVGSGVVPDHASGRRFRDVLGLVNAAWVAASHRAALVVAGRAIPLQPVQDALHGW